MSPMLNGLLLPFLVAMFLAINMGGSGTSPSFATAYGSGILRKDLIPGLFGLCVLVGALLAGKNTAITLGKGIIPAESLNYALTTIILFSVALSLLFANLLGVPQSTSQSTVLALAAPAFYLNQLNVKKVFWEIIPTWVVLPIISFGIMYLIANVYIKRFDNKHPGYFQTIKRQSLFRWVVIITSCYVAFSIGSNNVANASGPIASMITNELHINPTSGNFVLIMILATLIIAPSFGIGSSIFGRKLIVKTGTEIVAIGKVEASIISVITASLLLAASVSRGIPTSLVQLNTFAIFALSVSKKGWKETFSNKVVKRLWIIWFIAPVIAFILSYTLTVMADHAGLLHF
ncbi:MAG: inorganic phosphate transporter [Bacteroidia bacterium]|nr:inorganic phosphate transporter [Bacteroidia bacterium]